MTSRRLRNLSYAALFVVASSTGTSAQGIFSSPTSPPAQVPNQGQSSNPICARLEGQLAAVNRGGDDPARAEQTRRYEEAVSRQQAELDRMVAQGRRLGCESAGFFSLFSSQNPQCGSINVVRVAGSPRPLAAPSLAGAAGPPRESELGECLR